ncbi:MFS transporter [Kibdelosporangium lantanae]
MISFKLELTGVAMVLSLVLVVFGLTTGEFVIAGILPDVGAGVGVDVPAAGLLVTAYALGMIVGGPVVTVLTVRVPRKRLIVGLVAVAVVANAGSAVAQGYSMLIATRFVAGLVVATFFAVAVATAVRMAEPGREASTVARVTLGLNLGIVLGTPIGTFVGQQFGWRATFAAVSVICAVGLLMVLGFVPEQPHGEPERLGVFAARNVQLAILLTAVGNLGVVMVFTYISPLLTDASGFNAGEVPVMLAVYGAGAILGNFLGGWLADRRLMPALVGLLAVLVGVLVLFWWLSPVKPAAAVLTFVLGVLAFAIVPGMQVRVMSTASAAPTLAVAVNASGYQLAAAIGGWLGGAVVAGPGVRAVYLVAAAVTAVGLGVAIYSTRGRMAALHG